MLNNGNLKAMVTFLNKQMKDLKMTKLFWTRCLISLSFFYSKEYNIISKMKY